MLLACRIPSQASPAERGDGLRKIRSVMMLLHREHMKDLPEETIAQGGISSMRAELSRLKLPSDFLGKVSPKAGVLHQLDVEYSKATLRYPWATPNLTRSVLEGMAASYQDRFTTYLPPTSYHSLVERMAAGPQEGLGLYVIKDHAADPLQILESFSNSPAGKAGLQAGDQILAIDQSGTDGMTVDQAREKLAGAPGTPVTLKVHHQSTNLTDELTLRRDDSGSSTVESKLLPGAIGYLRIRGFAAHTSADVDTALKSLLDQKAQGWVVDLRNNGGGFVTAAVGVCSRFVPVGTPVVTVVTRRSMPRVFASTLTPMVSGKLVVLINENSASASELTAGTLSEVAHATLVGVNSYGKGSVQRVMPVGDGSALRVTTGHYHTPSGRDLNGVGLKPDVEVPMPLSPLGGSGDVQLQKAVQILSAR